jgi:hypothetical protein
MFQDDELIGKLHICPGEHLFLQRYNIKFIIMVLCNTFILRGVNKNI